MASRSYQTLNRDKTINRSGATLGESSSGQATLRRENTGPSRMQQSIECTGQFVLVDKKNPNAAKEGDRLMISNGVLRLASGLNASKTLTASDSATATLLLGSFCDVTFAADARTGGGIISFHKPSQDASDSASASRDHYATASTSSLSQSHSNATTATLPPTFALPVSHTLALLKPPDLSVHSPHSTDPAWDLFVAISAQHLVCNEMTRLRWKLFE